MINIFTSLWRLSDFEKKEMPFIETMEDRKIIVALGHADSNVMQVNAKWLHAQNLAPKATIERRLARMKQIGSIIREKRSKKDKRNVHLSLTPAVLRAFKKYEEKVKSEFAQ